MKRLAAAMLLSLIVHAAAAAFARVHIADEGMAAPGVAMTTIRIEKRAQPVEHVRTPPALAARSNAPKMPARLRKPPRVAFASRARPEHSMARLAPLRPRLRQVVALHTDFSQTIAMLRQRVAIDAAADASPAPEPSAADSAQIPHGDGILIPVKAWREGPYTVYMVRYTVRYEDGTLETGSVPWPLRYRASLDPFASGKPTRMDLPAPPEAFVLTGAPTPLVAFCYEHRTQFAVCPIMRPE